MKSYQTSSILCTLTNKSWLLISNVNLDLSITDIMSPWCTNLNLTFFRCWLNCEWKVILTVWESNFYKLESNFSVWNPTFPRVGFLESNFQNPSENTVHGRGTEGCMDICTDGHKYNCFIKLAVQLFGISLDYLFTIQSRVLTTLKRKVFENIVEKEENAGSHCGN